jgi:predicted nucleotidyltransferase
MITADTLPDNASLHPGLRHMLRQRWLHRVLVAEDAALPEPGATPPDVVLCHDLLARVSPPEAVKLFSRMRALGATWLAATHEPKENLCAAPFHLPAPVFVLPQTTAHASLAFWRLERLPVVDLAVAKHRERLNPATREDFLQLGFFRALCALPFVQKICLFGSRAIGRHRPDSDIDLMLFCDDATTPQQWLQAVAIVDKAEPLQSVDCLRYGESLRSIMDKWPPDFLTLYERGAHGPE